MAIRRAAMKATAETVELGGRHLPLAVKTHPRARRMTLKIEPGGRALSLTVPPGLPRHEIDGFLRRHHDWLLDKISRFPEGGDTVVKIGAIVPVLGLDHRITHSGNLRGLTKATPGQNERDPNVLCVSGPEDRAGMRVADYLKTVAKREIGARVAVHAAASGKKVASIAFKDTKTRWGSCSSKGNLNFSWRIAMAPPEIVDYLAAHEVAHLTEMNHGPRFWALCRKLCPQTESARAWLKENGTVLHAVRFE